MGAFVSKDSYSCQSVMIYVLAFQFHAYLQCLGAQLTKCLNTVLKVKAIVGALNQEKALVGAFSVIVKTSPIVRLQLLPFIVYSRLSRVTALLQFM